MLPGSWTGPDSVGLPSNDNGCEGVIQAQGRCTSSLHFSAASEAYWGTLWGWGGVMAAVGLLQPFGSSLCASVSSDGSSADDTLVTAVAQIGPALFLSISQSCQCCQRSLENPEVLTMSHRCPNKSWN